MWLFIKSSAIRSYHLTVGHYLFDIFKSTRCVFYATAFFLFYHIYDHDLYSPSSKHWVVRYEKTYTLISISSRSAFWKTWNHFFIIKGTSPRNILQQQLIPCFHVISYHVPNRCYVSQHALEYSKCLSLHVVSLFNVEASLRWVWLMFQLSVPLILSNAVSK